MQCCSVRFWWVWKCLGEWLQCTNVLVHAKDTVQSVVTYWEWKSVNKITYHCSFIFQPCDNIESCTIYRSQWLLAVTQSGFPRMAGNCKSLHKVCVISAVFSCHDKLMIFSLSFSSYGATGFDSEFLGTTNLPPKSHDFWTSFLLYESVANIIERRAESQFDQTKDVLFRWENHCWLSICALLIFSCIFPLEI